MCIGLPVIQCGILARVIKQQYDELEDMTETRHVAVLTHYVMKMIRCKMDTKELNTANPFGL